MDVRRMFTESAVRRVKRRVRLNNILIYWLGKWSWQVRDNWYRNTGSWLWGFESYISYTRECNPGPLDMRPIDGDEFKALCDEMFSRTDSSMLPDKPC